MDCLLSYSCMLSQQGGVLLRSAACCAAICGSRSLSNFAISPSLYNVMTCASLTDRSALNCITSVWILFANILRTIARSSFDSSRTEIGGWPPCGTFDRIHRCLAACLRARAVSRIPRNRASSPFVSSNPSSRAVVSKKTVWFCKASSAFVCASIYIVSIGVVSEGVTGAFNPAEDGGQIEST